MPVLRDMRTGRHGTYERLVLEFKGSFGPVRVGYVPAVTEDPSGRRVSMQGEAFLQVVVHSAAARWLSAPGAYRGPDTLTPGYRTMKQVKITGDFEAVLSVAVGLSRIAGFQVTRLRGPDRLVIDVAEPPAWRMWPDDSLAAARAQQAALEQGHQPWRSSPRDVAELFGRAVLGYDHPSATPAGTSGRFRVSENPGSPAVTIRIALPLPPPASVVDVADVR